MTYQITIAAALVLFMAGLILFIALRYHQARQRRITLAQKQQRERQPREQSSLNSRDPLQNP